MKKTIVIITGAWALLFINAGQKQKQIPPPGTVKINDTLFADETEISNFSWLEYVEYNKRKYGANSPEHIASLPDTTVWLQKGSHNEPYVQYYFRHVAYRDYPVVGVSYEQAKAYCVWRSERVNYFINIRDGKQINHIDSVFRGKPIYEYRLPTKKEWEAMAIAGISEKAKIKPHVITTFEGKKKISEERKYVFANTLENVQLGVDVTTPVYSYYPNKFGMYNLKGNVSEMISEQGIAKGGSWRDLEKNCFFLNDFNYTEPKASIGFRCVCVKKM